MDGRRDRRLDLQANSYVPHQHTFGEYKNKLLEETLTHYQTAKILDWSKLKQMADNILKCI